MGEHDRVVVEEIVAERDDLVVLHFIDGGKGCHRAGVRKVDPVGMRLLVKHEAVIRKGGAVLHRDVEARVAADREVHAAFAGIFDAGADLQGIAVQRVGDPVNEIKGVLLLRLLRRVEAERDGGVRLLLDGELLVADKPVVAEAVLTAVQDVFSLG